MLCCGSSLAVGLVACASDDAASGDRKDTWEYMALVRNNAARLERFILSAGGSRPPEELYTAFRGRMPGVEPLLKGRGLLDVA